MSIVLKPDLKQILFTSVEKKASDLHMTAGLPPMARVYGDLIALDFPVLRVDDIEELIFPLLDDQQMEKLKNVWELDFSYSVAGLSRFRGSIMKQRGSIDVAFRMIPWSIPRLEDLGLPPVVRELSRLPRGLVLVTGPTGSGKTTTLASIIDLINQERSVNIVTIENPIEFLHSHKKSIVRQREVGNDTHSFGDALRHLLRHDPDVILIGEMRDQESVAIALTAAETGHLVFSTLHTQTASLAIHRIVDVFSDSMRNQIRLQLADTLKGVVAQQILPRADNHGRVAAVEVLINTPAVSNNIREGKEHQLYTALQTGRSVGMQTMDFALAELCMRGLITRDMAMARSVDKKELERLLQ
jgi:twitching motility protein PilT